MNLSSALSYASASIIPLVTVSILLYAIFKKVNVLDEFLEGAQGGIMCIWRLFPTLLALVVSISMLTASGGLNILVGLFAPIGKLLSLPPEIMPLVILRPLSGSGSIALLQSMIATYGVDSLIATAAAVILTSTETTLYTTGIYYGSVKLSPPKRLFAAAFFADFIAIVGGTFIVRMLLFS